MEELTVSVRPLSSLSPADESSSPAEESPSLEDSSSSLDEEQILYHRIARPAQPGAGGKPDYARVGHPVAEPHPVPV